MTTTTEFPHEIPAAKIGREPTRTRFKADARACAALARRYEIVSVDSLEGEATLVREPDGMTIAVSGHFKAHVTQACVTTLEPVADEIEEDFEGFFLDESQATSFKRAKKQRSEPESDDFVPDEDEDCVPDERDEPEPVVGGMVDVGELVAQYLSLALNPYPHSEKALESGPVGDEKDLERPNPFAVLKDLKTK